MNLFKDKENNIKSIFKNDIDIKIKVNRFK